MTLIDEMSLRALHLGIPFSAHLDITYRCNERCIHCYLDHDDRGEMTTAEFKDVIQQLADAGSFFLTFSGGEVFLRRDFFELLEYARSLMFNVRIKTNGMMVRDAEAQRLLQLGIEQVQISVYSHRAEIHDAITKVPGSFKRTIDAIRFLKSKGLRVLIANILMTANIGDQNGVHSLARELEVAYALDPTITPMMDGDTSILSLRISGTDLHAVMHDESLVNDVEEYCAPPERPDDTPERIPCGAGHTLIYISPYGDVHPCVQFPMPSGNVRRQKVIDIWRGSPQLNELRAIRVKDLPVCSSCSHAASCSRCPGLAYMEGSMRGPSTADCEKSFYRTGVRSENMIRRGLAVPSRPLVQIQPAL